MFSPEAFALNVEYRGVIKDPVQRTQQRIVFVEVATPLRRALVAGEYNVEVAFLVVSPVNQVKEQPCILLVKLTVAHFVYNQAGGAHQTVL